MSIEESRSNIFVADTDTRNAIPIVACKSFRNKIRYDYPPPKPHKSSRKPQRISYVARNLCVAQSKTRKHILHGTWALSVWHVLWSSMDTMQMFPELYCDTTGAWPHAFLVYDKTTVFIDREKSIAWRLWNSCSDANNNSNVQCIELIKYT